MSTSPITETFQSASQLVYGCMGLGGNWDSSQINTSLVNQAHQVVETVLEQGINHFDHADIYTHGKAEQVFGQVLKQQPALREQMIIQSKCGIRFADNSLPGRYDFSPQWINNSVDGILARLHIEQLDVLLLHRPDPLMEIDEVADVFESLQRVG